MAQKLEQMQSALTTALRTVYDIACSLPQHGQNPEECQRQAILDATQYVQHTINELKANDMKDSDNYPDGSKLPVMDIAKVALTSALDEVCGDLSDPVSEVFFKHLGVRYKIFIKNMGETESETASHFLSEHEDTIKETLAHKTQNGLTEGEIAEECGLNGEVVIWISWEVI